MLAQGESLERLLGLATSPENVGPIKAAVEQFAVRVNQNPEGPRTAARLLATKVQSAHEWEAMQALNVLEHCMQACTDFVAEVAKFRFLNELIKVVSPKYLGNSTPAAVKTRLLEMLQSWTQQYPLESKIQEAYSMLCKQGVVVEYAGPVEQRPAEKGSVFEDDERARLLRRLLQSKHADDVKAANRLIKNMVREDERRSEQQSKVSAVLERVDNNVALLREMLAHYDRRRTSAAEAELIAELQQACHKLQPELARAAQDCDEPALRAVLAANDELDCVFQLYERALNPEESLLDVSTPDATLEDLTELVEPQLAGLSLEQPIADLSLPTSETTSVFVPPDQTLPSPLVPLKPASAVVNAPSVVKSQVNSDPLKSIDFTFFVREKKEVKAESLPKASTMGSGCDSTINSVTGSNIGSSPTIGEPTVVNLFETTVSRGEATMSSIVATTMDSESAPTVNSVKVVNQTKESEVAKNCDVVASPEADCKALLKDLSVSLESITPSNKAPWTVLSQPEGLTVVLQAARDCPRVGVFVLVVSIQSRVPQPLSNLTLQAVAADKRCRVRAQQPLAAELPAFNPFLPPPTATQLLLVANPARVPAALKFMISYCADDDIVTELAELRDLSFDF